MLLFGSNPPCAKPEPLGRLAGKAGVALEPVPLLLARRAEKLLVSIGLMTASLFVAVEVMLFLRDTRWTGLMEPTDSEWLWVLGCIWRGYALDVAELMEAR
jgi:hypothetical protein